MRHDFQSLKGDVGIIGPANGSLEYLANMLFKKGDKIKTKKRRSFFNGDDTVDIAKNEKLSILMGGIGISRAKETYLSKSLKVIDDLLMKENSYLIIVHGENDDLDLAREICAKLGNIFVADPYEMILTNKGNILCIGGGVQIDKNWRKNNGIETVNHCPIFDEEGLSMAIEGDNVDYVISPLAPTFIVSPPNKSNPWLAEDEELFKETMQASLAIDKNYVALLERMILPKAWYFTSKQPSLSIVNIEFINVPSKGYRKIVGDEKKKLDELASSKTYSFHRDIIGVNDLIDYPFAEGDGETVEAVEAPNAHEGYDIEHPNGVRYGVANNFDGDVVGVLGHRVDDQIMAQLNYVNPQRIQAVNAVINDMVLH